VRDSHYLSGAWAGRGNLLPLKETLASCLGRTPDQIRECGDTRGGLDLRPAAYSYFSLVLPALLGCVLSRLWTAVMVWAFIGTPAGLR
jgi:hypothetical protein